MLENTEPSKFGAVEGGAGGDGPGVERAVLLGAAAAGGTGSTVVNTNVAMGQPGAGQFRLTGQCHCLIPLHVALGNVSFV